MSTPSQNASAAAQQVFDTAELHQMILMLRDPKDILDHLHDDQELRARVRASRPLRLKLYLNQLPGDDALPDDDWKYKIWYPNRVLCPATKDVVEPHHPDGRLRSSGSFTFFRIGNRAYSLQCENKVERDPDDDTVFLDYFKYSLVSRLDAEHHFAELPPEYLNMYLSDRAEPITMSITSSIHRGSPHSTQPRLWIPAGTTVRKILKRIDSFAAGDFAIDEVVDGMYLFNEVSSMTLSLIAAGYFSLQVYRKKFEEGPLVLHGNRKVPRLIRTSLIAREEAEAEAFIAAEVAKQEADTDTSGEMSVP